MDEPLSVTPPNVLKKGIPFEKLRDGRCKFPLGSTDQIAARFCGAATPQGSPYCEHCRQLAYVPSVRRVKVIGV